MDKTLINPHVAWDVGGVLLKLTYGRFIDRLLPLTTYSDKDQFKTDSGALELKAIEGKIGPQEFLDGLRSYLRPGLQNMPNSELIEIRTLCWNGPVQEAVVLKQRLYENNYDMSILSNMTELAEAVISDKWPSVFSCINKENRIYSYEVGDSKPKPKIYDVLEELAGDKTIILIEDKSKYLKPIIERGGYGILFTPHIDPNESIRMRDKEEKIDSDKFKVASNVTELETALKQCGVII